MAKIDNLKSILQKRLEKAQKHYMALKEYKVLIDKLESKSNIYEQYYNYSLNFYGKYR